MTTRKLESPPSTITTLARAGLGAVPGAGRLPFLAGGGGEIPDLALELGDVEIDHDRLARYCRVCGFTVRETLPLTYPHVLAFPLHMALMTDSSFPFPAIGLVHLTNKITQRRPIDVTERLSVRVSATKLASHPKGRTFTILTEARVGDEPVWEGESTTLRRGGGAGEAARGADPTEGVEVSALPAEAEWRLPGDLGRRYAGVAGDRNPIHLYGLTAKALGFPRQIAHGMWTKARCVAQIEPHLPDAVSVAVAFKKPILLPAKVEFASAARAGGRIEFGVRDPRKGVPHLAGLAEPA